MGEEKETVGTSHTGGAVHEIREDSPDCGTSLRYHKAFTVVLRRYDSLDKQNRLVYRVD